jgi:hypothetical protein
MAMKKTFGGDSPLRQGAGKSFWILPILGSTAARIVMCSGKVIGYLGFSHRGVFIGEGAASEVDQGPTPPGGAGQPYVAPPYGVAALWLGSVSSSVFWKLHEISGRLAFVSSNSENISCVILLKHKNSRRQGTGTVASR